MKHLGAIDDFFSGLADDNLPFWRSSKKQQEFIKKLFSFKLIPLVLALGNLVSGLAGIYVFVPRVPVGFYTFDQYPWFLWYFLPDCSVSALLYIYFLIDYKRTRTGFSGLIQQFFFWIIFWGNLRGGFAILGVGLSPGANFDFIVAFTHMAIILEALTVLPFLSWNSKYFLLIFGAWIGLNEWLDFIAMPPVLQPMLVLYPETKEELLYFAIGYLSADCLAILLSITKWRVKIQQNNEEI
ncbi:MAG: hypothetical protein ACFFBD_16900 [Candidatus Hodarchaeota archaeon]